MRIRTVPKKRNKILLKLIQKTSIAIFSIKIIMDYN